MSRPRALQACTHCRARKVRCDVIRNGVPCSNCVFDCKTCHVSRQAPRGEKYRRAEKQRKDQDSATSPDIAWSIEEGRLVDDPGLARSSIDFLPDITDKVEYELTSKLEPFMLWSHYHFLSVSQCSRLPQRGMDARDQHDCLSVPRRPLLDQWISEYFLHVHPSLPVMDEGEFWGIYRGKSSGRISLISLQAMIFASCSPHQYVNHQCIKDLGFNSVRAARVTFYNRAKILYDLNSDHNQLQSAQCALIFTYYVSARCASTNTYWLAVAVHHAREAQAHCYYQLDQAKAAICKRVWWSCICRDRLLALGLRRALHIGFGDFDFTQPVPTFSDFENEVHGSDVYEADTKRALISLFAAQCELAVTLTDSLSSLFPRYLPVSVNSGVLSTFVSQLENWFKLNCTPVCPFHRQASEQDKSVFLYTNLLLAYYHSAQIVLLNHAISLSVENSINGESHHFDIVLDGMKYQLTNIIKGMDTILQEVEQMELLRFLPITMVAYITFPTAWYMISNRISPMSESEPNPKLKLYLSVMDSLKLQYEGTEELLDRLKTIVSQLQFQHLIQGGIFEGFDCTSPPACGQNGHPPTGTRVNMNLSDIAIFHPGKYLLITWSIDSCLSKGRLPDNSALQGLKNIIFLPPSNAEIVSPSIFSDSFQRYAVPDDFALYDLAIELGLLGTTPNYNTHDENALDAVGATHAVFDLPGLLYCENEDEPAAYTPGTDPSIDQ